MGNSIFKKTLKHLIIVCFVLFSNSIAKEQKKIIAAGDDNYPPYEFINEQGQPDGFNIELIRAVAEAMDLNVDIKLDLWSKVRHSLETGQIDLITGMCKSNTRDATVDFTTPYLMISYSLFAHKNADIKTVADMKGKKVLLQKGDISYDIMFKGLSYSQIIEVKNLKDAILLLASGQYDCAILPHMTGLYFINQKKITNLKIMDNPIDPKQYSFAVKQGDSKLLMLLNEGLNHVKQSGLYDKIYKKWFNVLENRYQINRFTKYILWLLLPFLFFILLILFWNWTLKKNIKMQTELLNKQLDNHKATEVKLLEYQKCLKFLVSGLMLKQEHQRKQFSDTLHNRVTQPLVMFKTNLQKLKENINGKDSKSLIDKVCHSLNEAIEDAYVLACNASTPVLHDLSLADAIREYISQNLAPLGIKATVNDQQINSKIDNDVKMLLYRDAKELLNNVIKHSKAKNVQVNIRKGDLHLYLNVKDDGVGFEYNQIFPQKNEKKTMGLFGIREKLDYFGGEMHVKSKIGYGTEVTIKKPLKLPDN